MAVNKVIYDQTTLIDLTGDDVVPAKLAPGVKAHNAAGGTNNWYSKMFPINTNSI